MASTRPRILIEVAYETAAQITNERNRRIGRLSDTVLLGNQRRS
jgi:hypothetical protein